MGMSDLDRFSCFRSQAMRKILRELDEKLVHLEQAEHALRKLEQVKRLMGEENADAATKS